jgi:hypothetical protein
VAVVCVFLVKSILTDNGPAVEASSRTVVLFVGHETNATVNNKALIAAYPTKSLALFPIIVDLSILIFYVQLWSNFDGDRKSIGPKPENVLINSNRPDINFPCSPCLF